MQPWPCRRKCGGIAENLGQSDELGLQIGIGLNSGEVVVRSISNDLNVDYSALGHTTHLAARMQELAGAGATPADNRYFAGGRGIRRSQDPWVLYKQKEFRGRLMHTN